MSAGEVEDKSMTQLIKDLYLAGECLDITAFILMTIFIGYTLTKYRKCNYDKISLIVMIIFWIRYLFRFTIISVSLIKDGEFN
jgi:mannose/fructose/N-acetylgalactosamine-specific phosphotransferase system component IIC